MSSKKTLTIFLSFVFAFVLVIVFSIIAFNINNFDERNVELELYIQDTSWVGFKYDENGEIHSIGNNHSCYIGIDKNRNLYVRQGDGIHLLGYFFDTEEDNPKKKRYDGYQDFIPEPKYENKVKLDKQKYETIISLMELSSFKYIHGSNSLAISPIWDRGYFGIYEYNGDYYDTSRDYDVRKKEGDSVLYDALNKEIIPYLNFDYIKNNISE